VRRIFSALPEECFQEIFGAGYLDRTWPERTR
jgi:hypothetical protein